MTSVARALGGAALGAAGVAGARWAVTRWRGKMARSVVEDDVVPERRILGLGGGFGGLYAAIRMADAFWDDPHTEVMLVDRQNYHLFTPMLTLVAGSAVQPRHVAFPMRRLLRDHHLAFQRREVRSIDLEARQVET